jgi:6-phosphogluconate dehydrogenase
MDSGWRVVGWNRTTATATAMESEGLVAAASLADLVAGLRAPRAVWLVVPAGAPVDALVDELAGLLSPGDTVIDAGNSHYAEAEVRAERLADVGVRFIDCGTSGGPAGARHGATLMIGGDRAAFEELEAMFADVAAPGAYRFFDGRGAGHFAKMVHNGIEYGMMQAIAEGFDVLHASGYDFDLEHVADIYQHRSVIESRLVGWLADKYAELGDDLEGVSGVVGHSGEGAWTIEVAEALGVPVPIIEASLAARLESEENPRYAGQVLTAMRDAFGGHGLGPGGTPRR